MKNTKQTPKEIKPLNVPLAPVAAATTKEVSDKLTVNLGSESEPSTDVKDYNHAAALEKAWKKVKEDIKPKLESLALTRLYERNTDDPVNPVKTVCLVDTTGAACNVTLKDTYSNVQHDPERIIDGLCSLGQLDPNKFVAEKVVIGFDTGVFYDENGGLRKEFYTAMMEAIQDVADEHGLASPFSSSKVVTVKPGFATMRWKAFAEAQQAQVSKLFPATVSLTPLASEKKAKV